MRLGRERQPAIPVPMAPREPLKIPRSSAVAVVSVFVLATCRPEPPGVPLCSTFAAPLSGPMAQRAIRLTAKRPPRGPRVRVLQPERPPPFAVPLAVTMVGAKRKTLREPKRARAVVLGRAF